MANLNQRVLETVPGRFFVDSTCIDCDACRQIAPSVFGQAAETSLVKVQPVSSAERVHFALCWFYWECGRRKGTGTAKPLHLVPCECLNFLPEAAFDCLIYLVFPENNSFHENSRSCSIKSDAKHKVRNAPITHPDGLHRWLLILRLA